MESSTLRIIISDMNTDMMIDIITGIRVYRRAEFKIEEQRSQIVWLLRKGSTITPNVLKWLADTISDYLCQLSRLSIVTFGTSLDDRIGLL